MLRTHPASPRISEWRRGEIIIIDSHVIVNLFTNIPIKEMLKMIARRLKQYMILDKYTNLVLDDIMVLLDFILLTTYFICDGQI